MELTVAKDKKNPPKHCLSDQYTPWLDSNMHESCSDHMNQFYHYVLSNLNQTNSLMVCP